MKYIVYDFLGVKFFFWRHWAARPDACALHASYDGAAEAAVSSLQRNTTFS
jgi:hypothetical protein